MQIRIRNSRASFLNIRQPYTPKTGDSKFTGNFICADDTEVSLDGGKTWLPHAGAMERAILQLCHDKWNGKITPKLENYAYCKADGSGTRDKYVNDDGEYYEGYSADTMFFVAGVKVKDRPGGPLIIDQKRNPLPAEAGHPISGDYVNTIINLFAYEWDGKKGISASLEGIQYLRQGEPFGAKAVEASAFDEEEVEEAEGEEGNNDCW